MWFVININEQGEENTLLTTRYKDIAQACAASLPGRNVCRFVAVDDCSANENRVFIKEVA